MKLGQIIPIGVAAAAAIGAGVLMFNQKPEVVEVEKEVRVGPNIEVEEVLVASEDLAVGTVIDGQYRWQKWPRGAIHEGFITRSGEPEADEELRKSVVRLAILAGEPIRRAKLIGEGESFMSSILPSGMRAVATKIGVDTSAGGFILPNDRVDVIMARRSETPGSSEGYVTETILRNIKVLAIDQTIQEDEEGQRVIVGQTATLELTPRQSEVITVAQQLADILTLSLRSTKDAREPIENNADYLVSGDRRDGTLRLIKAGKLSEAGTSN